MAQELDLIIAKIQSKVAEFLACKEKLIRLVNSSDISIKVDAESLLDDQIFLEAELVQALAKIDQIKTGKWSLQDIANLGTFAYNVNQHVGETNKLVKRAKGGTGEEESVQMRWLVWGGIGLSALFLIKRLFRD